MRVGAGVGRFPTAVAFRDGRTFRLTSARYNGQLAFEASLPGATAPHDLLVLTLAPGPTGASITAMPRFWPRGENRGGEPERTPVRCPG